MTGKWLTRVNETKLRSRKKTLTVVREYPLGGPRSTRRSGGRWGASSGRTSARWNDPTRRIRVRVRASLDWGWSRCGVLVVGPAIEAVGLTGVAWRGQSHDRSSGGVHR